LLREPDTSSPNPSTSRSKKTRNVSESFHVAQQVQKDKGAAVHADDMQVFSVAYVSGSIVRQALCGVSCDECKPCLTSEVLLRTSVFVYFKEYTYPSEKLVETVGTAVTLMESMMAEMANSVEQQICH
jgi:hypothetical protein